MTTRIVEKLTDYKFVNLFKVTDPAKNCKGYQFASRLGKDSIAFICRDASAFRAASDGEFLDKKYFILNREFTPPTDEFLFRAFGGSLDKEKTMLQIVMEEVHEEVGYKVKESDVMLMGKSFVSTQMDQYCYLFMVNVDDSMKTDRVPQNAMEAAATPTHMSANEIVNGTDWKSITILTKFFSPKAPKAPKAPDVTS
jgi:ADP-ribose pyrophosphatase YjhB (NUDIX family)